MKFLKAFSLQSKFSILFIMNSTLAFDVYGTLIDTGGVYKMLEIKVGTLAQAFMEIWRAKQLEYSFRRGLMQNYVSFSISTKQSLDFTCLQLNVEFSQQGKSELMHQYTILPTFADVADSLQMLKAANYRLFAFSNGKEDDVRVLLQNAGVLHFFEDVVSVDDVKTFKPSPVVYEHFLKKSMSLKTNSWLISGNPFDVTGAISAGMRAVWVKRDPKSHFDPWEIQPTETINKLSDLIRVLIAQGR